MGEQSLSYTVKKSLVARGSLAAQGRVAATQDVAQDAIGHQFCFYRMTTIGIGLVAAYERSTFVAVAAAKLCDA